MLALTSCTDNYVKPHLDPFFLLFLLLKKIQRSRLVNGCFYHTHNCVKLAQPTSNTLSPWVMLLMETVALLKSSNKHLVNTRRNQTYRPF